jgi:carboxylate-amine ligase
VQTLSRYLLAERPFPIDETLYAVYTFNRFQAARFGFAGGLIDPVSRQKRLLRDDFIETLARIAPHASALDTALFLESLKGIAESGNDARWMRETYARSQSLPDLVWRQAQRWRDSP